MQRPENQYIDQSSKSPVEARGAVHFFRTLILHTHYIMEFLRSPFIIDMRWISLVPSKIWNIFALR